MPQIEGPRSDAVSERIAYDDRKDVVVRDSRRRFPSGSTYWWRRIERREWIAVFDERGHFGGMRMPPSTRIDSA
ncbi:MAG: hypothetical protein ACO20Z_01745, partial [Ilumatobacteraceae bacterium]